MPEKFSQLGLDVEATGSAADDAKKPQKRGGKGQKILNSVVILWKQPKFSQCQTFGLAYVSSFDLKI